MRGGESLLSMPPRFHLTRHNTTHLILEYSLALRDSSNMRKINAKMIKFQKFVFN